MDALELLKNWPTWQKAGAKQLFDSPAWRLPIAYDGEPCYLVKGDALPEDPLLVGLTFDGEEAVLGIGDSVLFLDLHRLWRCRGQLPAELVLALVEKECGPLLQMLEDATKKLVAVSGLLSAGDAESTSFSFARRDGATMAFSLSLSPAMLVQLGRFENLDLRHPAIRGLSRPARAVYAELALEVVVSSLQEGDLLVLPGSDEVASTWLERMPEDGKVRICAPEESSLTFAQLADDALPAVPESEMVLVFVGARQVAQGRIVSLGQQRAVRLISIL